MINRIQYVLDNSLTQSGVNLVLKKWFKHTLCATYFTELILGSFGNGAVNKIKHYVLDILLVLLRGNYV